MTVQPEVMYKVESVDQLAKDSGTPGCERLGREGMAHPAQCWPPVLCQEPCWGTAPTHSTAVLAWAAPGMLGIGKAGNGRETQKRVV